MAGPSIANSDGSSPRRTWPLLAVIALFVVPIAVSWLYVQGWLDWRGRGMLNHGELVRPPVDVRQLAAPTLPVLVDELQPGEWAVLYLERDACADECVATLGRLGAIRSLLGNAGARVRIEAFAGHGGEDGHAPAQPATRRRIDSAALDAILLSIPNLSLPAVAFLDWRGQVMMHFPATAPPADIMKDLKRLLRASEIR